MATILPVKKEISDLFSGPLYSSYASLLVYYSLPIFSFRGFLGLPFENFFYLLLILSLGFTFLRQSSISRYILILVLLVGLLIINGSIFNNSHPYFSTKILSREVVVLLGIFVGYYLAKIYPLSNMLDCLYGLMKLVALIVFISFPMYDLGLIDGIHVYADGAIQRSFLPNQFHIMFCLTVFSPILAFHFHSRQDRFKCRVVLFYFYALIFIFSFRSSTRSVLILGSISFLYSLYATGYLKRVILILSILCIATLPTFLNSSIVKRILEFDLEKSDRLVELEAVRRSFEDDPLALITGYGVGVGTLKKTALKVNNKMIGEHVVISPHIGFIAPLYKGGLLFFGLFLLPLFFMLLNVLRRSSRFYKVFLISLLLFYLQSLLSGGYIFIHLLTWMFIFTLARKLTLDSEAKHIILT